MKKNKTYTKYVYIWKIYAMIFSNKVKVVFCAMDLKIFIREI